MKHKSYTKSLESMSTPSKISSNLKIKTYDVVDLYVERHISQCQDKMARNRSMSYMTLCYRSRH